MVKRNLMVLKSHLALKYNRSNKKKMEHQPAHFEKKFTQPRTGNKYFFEVGRGAYSLKVNCLFKVAL